MVSDHLHQYVCMNCISVAAFGCCVPVTVTVAVTVIVTVAVTVIVAVTVTVSIVVAVAATVAVATTATVSAPVTIVVAAAIVDPYRALTHPTISASPRLTSRAATSQIHCQRCACCALARTP